MNIDTFIDGQGINLGFDAFCREVESFELEMQRGLAGGESSLKMIPSYVPGDVNPRNSQKAIAVDMGGTNLRVALLSVEKGGLFQTEMARTYPMPGRAGEIDRETLFDALAEYLVPFLEYTNRIGLCFSFPCEIQPDLDGKVLHFNKEVRVRGAEGIFLRENLQKALLKLGATEPITLAVINDTVATLLGAKAQTAGRAFGGYIGFILGTGTNTCYAEQNGNIGKNSTLHSRGGKTIVNLESGGYAGAKRMEADIRFDAKTAVPGTQLLEKMLSGAYLGGLFLEHMKVAANAGCFSPQAADALMELRTLEARDIDHFCDNAFGKSPLAQALFTEQDRRSLYQLASAFYERAAFLIAVNLAAVLKTSGQAWDMLHPVCISSEGSTFRKSRLLHGKAQYYMEKYAHRKMGLQYEFLYAEDTTIIGSAYAALLV